MCYADAVGTRLLLEDARRLFAEGKRAPSNLADAMWRADAVHDLKRGAPLFVWFMIPFIGNRWQCARSGALTLTRDAAYCWSGTSCPLCCPYRGGTLLSSICAAPWLILIAGRRVNVHSL